MTSGDLFPSVPARPTAIAGDRRATVTVAPGAPGNGTGGPASRFTVTASPGGATCTVSVSAGGTCEMTGLANGTAYGFTATATNSAGTSAASAPSTAVTPRVPRLAARTRCVLGRCTTTGSVPAGATRVTQAAVTARAAKRATGRCTIKATGTGAARARTYTCTIRLSRGWWGLTTQARSASAVTALSVKPVRVARTSIPVVAG
jgi:hypothetical protein